MSRPFLPSEPTRALLESHGFKHYYGVENGVGQIDIFERKNRCGIYVLIFRDGSIYAGLSLDVRKRFAQHRLNHKDIVGFTFVRRSQRELAWREVALINDLERHGHRMRNLALMSVVSGACKIDELIDPSDLNFWVTGVKLVDASERINDAALRQRYLSRFEQFTLLPNSEEIITLLRIYTQNFIPMPRKTELAFWTSSCLPSGSTRDVKICSRINLNMMEVATIMVHQGLTQMSFHVAESSLRQELGEDVSERLIESSFGRWSTHRYKSGGIDQCALFAETADEAMRMMDDYSFFLSARTMNARLMKKGPCYYSQSHCLSLADRLLE